MIDLVLRHAIYDVCLDVMFNKINFNLFAGKRAVPKVGDYFTRVSHVTLDEHYFGCIITEVIQKVSQNGDEFHMVYFTYNSSEGVDLEDWRQEIEEMEELYENDEDDEILDEEDDGFDDEDEDDSEFELYMLEEDSVGVNAWYYIFVQ